MGNVDDRRGRPVADETEDACCGGVEPAAVPIACTLGAAEVGHRIDEWAAVLAHVTGREAIAGGIRLTLDRAAPHAELVRLVIAEQACCAFLAFAVTVDGRGAALEVRAPEDAEEVVAALFGSA